MLYQKNKIITEEVFLNATIKDISQVYIGKRNHCRCGCGGDYVYTTFGKADSLDVVDNALVEKRLARAKKIVEKGVLNVRYNDSYVDVETGKNRTLTFYFDDLKPEESAQPIAKFYQAVLTEVKGDIIDHVYPRFKNSPEKPTLNDRLPNNGACEECGKREWILLPKESVPVRCGEKPYIECLGCGFRTHL